MFSLNIDSYIPTIIFFNRLMEKIGVIGYHLLNLRRHIYRKVHVWLGLSLIVTVTKIQLKCVKAWEIDAKKYQSAFMHK